MDNDKGPASIARRRPLFSLGNSTGWRKYRYYIGTGALLILSLVFSFVIYKMEIVGAALLFGAMLAGPIIFGIVAHPKFGILVLLIMAYLLFFFIRMGIPFPLGTLMDGIQALLILGFFIKQKFHPNWKIYKSPVSIIILVWVAYNFLEIANPVAESRLAWVYTVRSVGIVMLMYFIFMYQVRDIKYIRLLLKIWLVLAFIGAAYAFKQEYFGFSASEMAYLNSDPEIAGLLFIGGHWRKYSIFSDPVSFSYNMVISSLMCIVMIAGNLQLWKKIVLAILAGFFLMTMLYSGTRGAYVLVPAGLLLYAILNYNKRVMIFTVIAGIFLTILIFIPTGSPSIQRFQSAFRPNEDASYKLRKYNQKRIQPFMQSHPLGAGLGAAGEWGRRFSPGSFLAHFEVDSGYVRVAVEMGWIGLILFCTLMFIILRTGIMNYYSIKDPELKNYCLAATVMAYAICLGNFPQEAIVQFPTNVFFYLTIALINITYQLDQEKQLKGLV
ncbi:MAG: O-antigen ligase family protein [Taibaiella sp.]|nr:O-antigen ligase family protein [Taibaiella sp.]